MNRNRVLISLALLVAACPALRAQSGSLPKDYKGLRGISAVEVVVESLGSGASRIGLTEDVIQTDVELRLRSAGLRAVSHQEWLELPVEQEVILYVNVAVLPSVEAARADVRLSQGACLLRNAPTAVVTTWQDGRIQSNPTATGIRNSVKDMVDSFLNDWLKQNPRR